MFYPFQFKDFFANVNGVAKKHLKFLDKNISAVLTALGANLLSLRRSSSGIVNLIGVTVKPKRTYRPTPAVVAVSTNAVNDPKTLQ